MLHIVYRLMYHPRDLDCLLRWTEISKLWNSNTKYFEI